MSASSAVKLHFRCVALEERILEATRNVWRISFAPITALDGSDNTAGMQQSFTITVTRPAEARTFAVGEIYEFEIRTAPSTALSF